MKIFIPIFLILSFVSITQSFAMNHNGTDIESSDSENEEIDTPEEFYLKLDSPGRYLFFFAINVNNKDENEADFKIGLSVNNKKASYVHYKINGNSSQIINGFLPVSVNKDDLIEIKWNAPEAVSIESYETDFVNFEPKNKL